MSLTNKDNLKLRSAMANWRSMGLQECPIHIKSYSNGLNNETHLISAKNQYRVLKLFSKPSPYAIAAQQFAARLHIAPQIFYVNDEQNVALIECVDSTTASLTLKSQDIHFLAKALKTLHSNDEKNLSQQVGDFDLIGFYTQYLSEIHTNTDFVNTTHKQLEPIIDLFLKNKTTWCICHNDLVKENVFITDQSVNFIDWEYCQVNNPWFDLSTLIYTLKLDEAQTQQLIKSYQPDWLNDLNTPFYFSVFCAMLWCDILWFLANGYDLNTPELQEKRHDLQRYIQRVNQLL